MKTNPTPHAPLDVIGDIHGHYDKLKALLRALGYRAGGDTWRHPEGRRVVFVGDYIDRGPRIRQVLRLVRGMVEAGDALALMGNHEFNAVCYHTGDGNGGHLRARHPQNRGQHAMTMGEFFDRREEWDGWIEWMKGLPFHLDLGGLRAVHAAWDPAAIRAVAGASLRDPGFLRASATRGTPEFRAVEILLKGVELDLPDGDTYADKDGHHRRSIRTRWWENSPLGATYRGLVFPPSGSPPELAVPEARLDALPGYGDDEPPVFVGHYWMPQDAPLSPLRPNLACLDYSAAHTGPLVAYRWDGERVLAPQNFVIAPRHEA